MKDEYKPATSLVNGELVRDLMDLCNNEFVDPFKRVRSQLYCSFCGSSETGDSHFEGCPSIKYKEIVEKHKDIVRVKKP